MRRDSSRRWRTAWGQAKAGGEALREPLSHRLLAGVFVVSFAAAALVTLIELGLDYHHEVTLLRSELELRQRHAEGRLSQALQDGDAARLQRELTALLTVPPIFHVQLVASDGRYYAAGRPVQPLRDRLQRTAKLEVTGPDGRRQLQGSVLMETSTSPVKSRLVERFLIRLALQSLKAFVVAAFILVFFRSLVTQHLAYIAAQMRRSTALNLRQPLQLDRPHGSDEIADLAQAFNQMRRNLLHEIEIREQHDRSVTGESALYQLTLDSLPQAALRLTPEGGVAWLNAAARQLCKLESRMPPGGPLAALLPAICNGAGQSAEALFLKARLATQPVAGRLLLAGTSGAHEHEAQAVAIRDEEGQLLGVLLLVQAEARPALQPEIS
jgi:PAS domain-containing protein